MKPCRGVLFIVLKGWDEASEEPFFGLRFGHLWKIFSVNGKGVWCILEGGDTKAISDLIPFLIIGTTYDFDFVSRLRVVCDV